MIFRTMPNAAAPFASHDRAAVLGITAGRAQKLVGRRFRDPGCRPQQGIRTGSVRRAEQLRLGLLPLETRTELGEGDACRAANLRVTPAAAVNPRCALKLLQGLLITEQRGCLRDGE